MRDTTFLYNYAIDTIWTPLLAQEFHEPAWNWHEPSRPKPYTLDSPYTHAEVEALFRAGLTAYTTPATPVTE